MSPNCQPLMLPKKASINDRPTTITPNNHAHGWSDRKAPPTAIQNRPTISVVQPVSETLLKAWPGPNATNPRTRMPWSR